MPFLLLLLLAIACWPDSWPRPFWAEGLELSGRSFALLTWSAMVLMVAAAGRLAAQTRRGLLYFPSKRDAIFERYSRGRFHHLLGLLLVYGISVYVLGWGWTVRNLGPEMSPDDFVKKFAKNQQASLTRDELPSELTQAFASADVNADGRLEYGEIERLLKRDPYRQMFPGAELLILAPFLAALIASWACFYEVDKTLHDTAAPAVSLTPFCSRWAYILFHVRHNLYLVLVLIVVLVIEKALRRLPDLQGLFETAILGLLVTLLVAFPWVLRLVLGLKPLPAGPLRDRLLGTARRLRFRFSNILVWNTNGGVANAMVAGILPQVRYVVLTDKLVNELAPEEVEAVFGHEVGHVKHHHMVFYLAFIIISLLTLSVLATVTKVDDLFKSNEDLATLPLVGILGGYIFVVFGFLSRRCERQADIYGCRTMSCSQPNCTSHAGPEELTPRGRGLCATGIGTFIDALEKVARLNGISRNRPGILQSWQHSTIARRVDFLQRLRNDPSIERRFQRTVRIVKWAVVVLLAVVLVVLIRV
jgi:Zn-dependent protease with chaperone function